MLLTAMKPLVADSADVYHVLYRGPLSQVTDERGTIYPRGTRVDVDQATWNMFQQPAYMEHFTCFRCVDPATTLVKLA